jgi:hypothetical protein
MSGGSDPPPLDPLIAALIQKLPPANTTDWKVQDRVMWLQMIAMAFQMAYGAVEMIEIKTSDQTAARSYERRHPAQEGPSEVLPPVNAPPHLESYKQGGT